jgi:transcription initiation factor TFIIB
MNNNNNNENLMLDVDIQFDDDENIPFELINKSSKKTNKSQKKKKKITRDEKTNLWNIFESQVENSKKMECLCQTIKERDYCEQCESILEYSDEGFLTCTNTKCGIIYKDSLDQSPEWRFYGADDNQSSDPTRCGMPINPLLEESSFACKVLCQGKTSYEMRKIRRYNEWQSVPYKEKTRYNEFQRIMMYAQIAGISTKIVDDAIKYHKKISEYEHSFRGDNKNGLLIASIYVSFRINEYPRTAKELAAMFNLDVAIATKGCKLAMMILNDLESEKDNEHKTHFVQTTPNDFIERYCSRLNINAELTQLCKFISVKIEKENLMQSNAPNSIAAGIVYYISHLCNLNVSKADVSNVSEISEVTINKCYKTLELITEKLIPSVIIRKYNIQI